MGAVFVHLLGGGNVVVGADAAALVLAEQQGPVVLAAELVDVG